MEARVAEMVESRVRDTLEPLELDTDVVATIARLRELLGEWLALETRRNNGEGYSAPLVERTRTALKEIWRKP